MISLNRSFSRHKKVMPMDLSGPTLISVRDCVRSYNASSSPSPRSYAPLVYVHVVSVIFVILAVPPICVCQSNDQTYIFIQPQRALISLNHAPTVVVACRHLPETAQTGGAIALTLYRRPLAEEDTNAEEQVVRATPTSIVVSSILAKRFSADWSKEDPSRLLLTIAGATCQDALFTYRCFSRMSFAENSATATFNMLAAPQKIALSTVWSASEITLQCQTPDVAGLITGSDAARGQWVWEFNDVGRWTPPDTSDVKEGEYQVEDTCLQFAPHSQLTVSVLRLRHCRRLYRCYLRTGSSNSSSSVGNAQYFVASKGPSCGLEDVTQPSAAAAIFISFIFMLFFLCAAVLLNKYSLEERTKHKKEFEEQILTRILSPMKPTQTVSVPDVKLAKIKLLLEKSTPSKMESTGVDQPGSAASSPDSSVASSSEPNTPPKSPPKDPAPSKPKAEIDVPVEASNSLTSTVSSLE